jgi:hypothetical protein
MTEQDEFLAEVRDRLEQAQQHYKVVYDRRHHLVEFVMGQWVWLVSYIGRWRLSMCRAGGLGPKFFGPY